MKSRTSFLWILFFFTLLILTVSSAQAQVPSKARVAIHVGNRFWSLNDASVLISFSNGTPAAVQKIINGTADLLLPPGEYKAKILKTIFGIEQAIGNQTFEVIDTIRSYQVNVTEELYSLRFTVLDSSLTLDSLINVTDSDGHRFLDNSTVRLEFCLGARDKDSGEKYYWHSLGLLNAIPFKQISLQKSWFPEYGVKRPPHIENPSTYGYWMHRETIQGIFHVPYPVPKGSYLVKVWDGPHLIGKFNLNVTNDTDYTLYVPYDAREQANYVRAQVNELYQQNATLSVKVVTPELEPVANANVTVKSAVNAYSEITTTEGWANFTLPIYQTYTVHVSGAFKAPEPCSVWLDGDKELIIDPEGSGASLTIQNGRFYLNGVRTFLYGVNLFNGWYASWSYSTIDKQLDLIKQAGFNHVRILVYGSFINPDGTVNTSMEPKVKYFMDACKKRGLIVNFNLQPRWGGSWGRLQDGAVNYNLYYGSARWLKTKGYDNVFMEVIWEVGTWAGDWDQTLNNPTLFRNTIEQRAKACKDGYPEILTAAMCYGWSSTVNMPFKPTVLFEPYPVVDIYDDHDYSGGTTESTDTLSNMAKYPNVATIFDEFGGGWQGYTVEGTWSILKGKMGIILQQGSGYAYWNWYDYESKPLWGIVDISLQTKLNAYDLFKNWIAANQPPSSGRILLGVKTVDANGDALSGASVIIKGPISGTYITDSNGLVNSINLKPGEYKITVKWIHVTVNTTSLSLASNSMITIRCRVYDLTIRVVYPNGTSAAGEVIDLFMTDGNYIVSARTNSDGYCTFRQLPIQVSSYIARIGLFHSNPFPLTNDRNMTLVFTQETGGGGEGGGEGDDGGSSVSQSLINYTLTVRVLSTDGNLMSGSNVALLNSSGIVIAVNSTNEAGVVNFSVAPGNYTIVTSDNGNEKKTTVTVNRDKIVTLTRPQPSSSINVFSSITFPLLLFSIFLFLCACFQKYTKKRDTK